MDTNNYFPNVEGEGAPFYDKLMETVDAVLEAQNSKGDIAALWIVFESFMKELGFLGGYIGADNLSEITSRLWAAVKKVLQAYNLPAYPVVPPLKTVRYNIPLREILVIYAQMMT